MTVSPQTDLSWKTPSKRRQSMVPLQCESAPELICRRILDQTEKDLLTSVALKDPTYSGLELQLAKYGMWN